MISNQIEAYFREGANIISPSGYHSRFLHYVGEGQTHREAWESVEGELSTYFNMRRFHTYDAFRAAMSRRRGGNEVGRVVLTTDC